jgi:hypothetical protein
LFSICLDSENLDLCERLDVSVVAARVLSSLVLRCADRSSAPIVLFKKRYFDRAARSPAFLGQTATASTAIVIALMTILHVGEAGSIGIALAAT